MATTTTAATLTRPADETLQAYVDWVRGMRQGLSAARTAGNDTTPPKYSQDEWERRWRGFWQARERRGGVTNKRNWRAKAQTKGAA